MQRRERNPEAHDRIVRILGELGPREYTWDLQHTKTVLKDGRIKEASENYLMERYGVKTLDEALLVTGFFDYVEYIDGLS